MTTVKKNIAEDRLSRESDAQAAEERYLREVIAHVEAIKSIEDLKWQLHNLQRPHKPNWPLQKAAGVSNGKRLTGKLPILPPGAVIHRRSVVKAHGKELCKQENARLEAQMGHLTCDLEEDMRATLSDEWERAASVATMDTQHAESLEKIQQLNLLHKSNAMLHADSEAHLKRSLVHSTFTWAHSIFVEAGKEVLEQVDVSANKWLASLCNLEIDHLMHSETPTSAS
ncbi:hypothetical protein F5888DRAFT_1632926 [Russula emetica]|nr:hypothetical protein F5888DRAFT_1632926 [Russula emetica]